MSRDFCCRFFFVPKAQAPENNIRVISKIFENFQRYSKVQVQNRYQRHPWSELEGKIYLHLNSTTQRYPNRIMKTLLIEDFIHLPPLSQHRWRTLSCEYLSEFSKKFETAVKGYSGACGKLIQEKTWSRNSLGTVPFKKVAMDLKNYRFTGIFVLSGLKLWIPMKHKTRHHTFYTSRSNLAGLAL